MSYRDVRNFTEMMRALGYHRLISIENFRSPNFPLVAEVLKWLLQRYDPNSDVPTDTDTENDRVIFIKSVAQILVLKSNIRLNTKKLYSADGFAVKELLKVASVLYNAMKANNLDVESSQTERSSYKPDITSKVSDLKAARQLASDITTKGAALHDLLSKELELRDARDSCLARPMDLDEIERSIQSKVHIVSSETRETGTMLENIASDEANLEAKIEKRKQELERNQKRLRSLESVRPAFMDEYEKLESDLRNLYEGYIERYRNLSYLDQLLEDVNKSEQEKIDDVESSLKRTGDNGLLKDELANGSLDAVQTDSDEDWMGDNEDKDNKKTKRPKGGTERRNFGSMNGGMDSDHDDSAGLSSDGSGSDIGLENGEDLLDDDDDDEDIVHRKPSQKDLDNGLNNSDDDF